MSEWANGQPPAKAGLYLLELSPRHYVAAEVYWWNRGEGESHAMILVDDSAYQLGAFPQEVQRHYGPIKKPEGLPT